MITVEQIRKIIQAEYDDDTLYNSIYKKLENALKPFDGKPVSKRMETAFNKAYPEYTTYWDDQYSLYYLAVYSGDSKRDINHSLRFLIARKPFGSHYAPEFDISKLSGDNAWATRGVEERNAQRTKILNNEKHLHTIAKALNDYEDACFRIESAMAYPFPDSHSIQALVKYKSR
jgi:hypothetical protein